MSNVAQNDRKKRIPGDFAARVNLSTPAASHFPRPASRGPQLTSFRESGPCVGPNRSRVEKTDSVIVRSST